MIRINLLPPEILEKRKDESRWRWVLFGGLAALVVLAMFYLVMFLQVAIKEGEVAGVEQEAAQLQAQADQVQIFKEQEDDLKTRQAIVDKALLGRVDWATILYDISLVLPSDIYLITIAGIEDDPLTFTPEGTVVAPDAMPSNESNISLTGNALDPDNLPDTGFKTIAALLVRLGDLPELQRVWLTTGLKNQAASTQNHEEFTLPPYISFTIQAQTVQARPPVSEDAAAVPAPPPTTP